MSLKQGRYDILQENRNNSHNIRIGSINHNNENLILMENNNMTGENVPFTSGERGYANYAQNSHHEEKREPKFGFWNLVLTLIFLFSFFGCVYLYFENCTLKEEIQHKHLLIMDLGELLKRKNGN